jgi:hypothetical protein
LLPPFLAGRDTQVIVRSGAVRVDIDCPPQFHKRIIEPRLLVMNNPKRGEHEIVIRRNSQGFL